MMRPIIVMLLGYLAVGARAQDTCVSSLGFAQGNASTIGLTFGADVPHDVVQSAVEMWNTCSDYATGFPSFVTGANGDVTISIAFAETGASRGCGQFQPVVNGSNQVTGGTVTLFGVDVNGNSCAGQHASTLAHEFGHVLGLEDSADCPGYIMGPPSTAYTRSVQQSECDESDKNWRTDAECLDVNENGVCDVFECADANQNGICDGHEDLDKDPNEDSCPGGPPCSSPLLINLGGGRWHLAGTDEPVHFDINADGVGDSITWTGRGSTIAFLAIDRNGNSYVDNGAELFGNWTVLASGSRARNGFEALKEFDSNGDGWVTADDSRWSALLLWTDTNHDGISQRDELQSIASRPVSALGTRYHWTGRRDRSGNFFGYEGLVHVGGARRAFYDVYFRSVPK